jgi:predicted nucleic acid-binding protein
VILYLDTSSMVKLYVDESGSSLITALVKEAAAVGTSIIAYAEARAAFARRFREKAFTAADYKRLILSFEGDWPNYFMVSITQALAKRAGHLAEKHALRGYDAVHLASALILKDELKEPPVFSCFDEKLGKASLKEGLAQPPR